MPYAILTAIGAMYKSEAGSESAERFPVLEALSVRLQTHIKLADRLKALVHGSSEVAMNIPKTAGLKGERVKALTTFHEQTVKRWTYIQKVNGEVAYLRKWLSRQGVHQTAEGNIVRNRSTRRVEYDTTLEQQGLTRLTFQNGLMYLKGKPFDTSSMVTHFSGPYHCIYVMSREGNFHVSSHAVGHRHHSSLLGGQHVAGAGEMRVQQGRLVFLSNKSGHYHPDLRHFFQTLAELQARQVQMSFSVRKSPEDLTFATVDDFLAHYQADNEAFEAQRIFKAVDADNMSYFLSNRDLAFLTPAANPDVSTAGFHTIKDGYPPYWRSPEAIRNMLIEDNVPMTHSYIKSGAGR